MCVKIRDFLFPAILAQTISCSRQPLLTHGLPIAFWVVSLSISVVVISFVRDGPKGWTKAPVLDGWVQIVRGPRPEIGAVAQREVREEKSPITRYQGCSSVSPSPSVQPPTRASRSGGRRGGLQVGGSSEGSWRREQRSRETLRSRR